MHIKLEFGSPKNDQIIEGTTRFTVGTYSYLKITKSKLGPKFDNIPCYVDVRQGGLIDKVRSFYMYLRDAGYIQQGGGWLKLDQSIDYMTDTFKDKLDVDALTRLKGNKREKDLIDLIRGNEDLLNFLQVLLIEKISDIYPAHSLTTNAYRQKLIDNCNYFIDKNIETRNVSDSEMKEFESFAEDDEENSEEIIDNN